MTMITAEEARQLAGKTVEEKVESLCATIRELASEHKRVCRCGYDHAEDADLWIHGGYSGTKDWMEAKKILEGAGFEVSFFYEERQFVDMYTLVKW